MNDILIKAITKDGSARAYAINSTNMVNKAADIHKTTAVMSAALGRLLSAGSMMGAMLKDENNSLTLMIKGSGKAKGLTVVADSFGNTRGYANNPFIELPLNNKGKLDVSGAIGKNGHLTVIKDMGNNKPYIGRCEIVSGEIAEDITNYFAKSEQTPSVCALGVLVNTDLSILAAGGFIVQLMPFATEETIVKIEENLKNFTCVTELLSKGKTLNDILNVVLSGFEIEILSEQEVFYKCTCSRERMLTALISIGRKELEKLFDEQEKAELHCHFCNKFYDFSKEEIEEILNK